MPDHQERETLIGEPDRVVHADLRHRRIRVPARSGSQPAGTPIPSPRPGRSRNPAGSPTRPRGRGSTDVRAHPAPAHPVVVPGAYQYVKRWTFVLVVAGVWIVAAAIGLGLYYWWYHSVDKTPPVFVVLIYLVVCTVGGLLIAMVQNKPLMSALAIALMSAPLASTAARGGAVRRLLLRSGRSLPGGGDSLLG